EAESPDEYIEGGFHPVSIDDRIGKGGRFKVIHKLGNGGFGTVWLCDDTEHRKLRAVKIMAADESGFDAAELLAMNHLKDVDRQLLDKHHIQVPLEHFWIQGPNGQHLCFVQPFLGCQITDLFKYYAFLPELLKDICFQLADAMRFLHSKGLCHADFRPDNILLRLIPGVEDYTEAGILKYLGEPELVPVIPNPEVEVSEEDKKRVPKFIVKRASINYGSALCSTETAVVDFGISFPVEEAPNTTGIPQDYQAPEATFKLEGKLTPASDIWSLAICFLKIRLGFEPFKSRGLTNQEGLINMETIVGPLPRPYREKWRGWEAEFMNCTHDNPDECEICLADETQHVTIPTELLKKNGASRFKEHQTEDFLLYRLRCPQYTLIDEDKYLRIMAQDYKTTGRLPTCSNDVKDRDNLLMYTMENDEADQLYDLLKKVFKWMPEERASLDEIINHEWFGGRYQKQ
ncbi:kinase-like domain-containing protein, partial [Podospora didyma]